MFNLNLNSSKNVLTEPRSESFFVYDDLSSLYINLIALYTLPAKLSAYSSGLLTNTIMYEDVQNTRNGLANYILFRILTFDFTC